MAGNKQKQMSSSSRSNSSNGSNGGGIIHNNQNHHNNHQQPQQHQTQQQSNPVECFNCHKPIKERYLLKALDQYWHEDCLKCSCCDCRLGEVGSTLFTKANLILCKRDYLRLFGNTGFCSACNKTIPGFEMVMRAKSNVYHLECFSCFQCHQKFCVGDRFYLHENKILCEYDFEERMVFANLSRNNNNNNNSSNNSSNVNGTAIGLDFMRHHHHHPGPSPSHQAVLAAHLPPGPPLHHPHHLQQHPHHPHHPQLHHPAAPPPPSHPLNKIDGEICDASSGYGSGDSPFDH